jgi:hypothetical protein
MPPASGSPTSPARAHRLLLWVVVVGHLYLAWIVASGLSDVPDNALDEAYIHVLLRPQPGRRPRPTIQPAGCRADRGVLESVARGDHGPSARSRARSAGHDQGARPDLVPYRPTAGRTGQRATTR